TPGNRSGVRQPRHGVREGRGGARTRTRLRRSRRPGGRRIRRRRADGGRAMTTAEAITTPPPATTWATLRRGLSLSPELRTGLLGTLALAIASMVGRVAVPIAIQQGIDDGLQAPGGPNLGRIAIGATLTVAILAVTTTCGYFMMRRLFTV